MPEPIHRPWRRDATGPAVRPAVSHHLQVLPEAGVIKARKEATHVFYYLDPQDSEIENMTRLFADIRRILRNAPDKSGED